MLVQGLNLTWVLIVEDFLRLKWHLAHLGCALAATETGALEIVDLAGLAWLPALSAGAVVCCPVCWISRRPAGGSHGPKGCNS